MVRKVVSGNPSYFCEWAIGSTINSALRKLEKERLEKEQEEVQQKRDVIKVELATNDESETDSVRVTYPRSGANGRIKGTTNASSGMKQVRFEQGLLKPALKKKKSRKKHVYESSGSDTPASESESGTDATRSVDASTSKPSDSEATLTDSDTSRRRKSHKPRRSKGESSGDSDPVYDSNCSDCERDLAKKSAKERRLRRKYASDPESSTGSEKVRLPKKDEKHRRFKKERRSGFRKDDPVDVDSDSGTSNHGNKKLRRGKDNKEHRSKGGSPKDKVQVSSKDRKSALSSNEKTYPEAMPGPHPRRPNLIRPIRAEVMQVEHTVEGPEDPRPNAFVDERNNIVRVYHGPAYGNPLGKLYPRRDPSLRPLPLGVPHPTENPYYHGFRDGPQQNCSHSPQMGHMATTLGDPYSSIPANAPVHPGPGPGPHDHGTNDLTSGLWGLDSPNATQDKGSSWSNNVGPPQPSASLRKANPNSRWGFGGSKKWSRKDTGDGSVKDSWGQAGNSGWGDAGNKEYNTGRDAGDWGSKAGDNNKGWNGAGDGDSWGQGNDAAGDNNSWNASNQGGSAWGDNENIGNTGNNPSPSQRDAGGQDSTSWGNNGGDDNWGATNNNDVNAGDDWGASNDNDGNWTGTGNNNTWDAATDNASNNVVPSGRPPGPHNRSSRKNYVPGAWEGSPPEKRFPSWGDPTAAQSTQNQTTW